MHRIMLSDSSSLDRVRDFFRAAHVIVHVESSLSVRVHVPGAATAAHELSEISGYVTTWNALNPGLRIQLVDDADEAVPGSLRVRRRGLGF